MDMNQFRKHLAKAGKKSLHEGRLKMSPEHYAELKKRISALKDKIPAHLEIIKNDSRVKDLGKRLRWDTLWATKFYDDHRDLDLDDTHMDSALKAIFKELGIKES